MLNTKQTDSVISTAEALKAAREKQEQEQSSANVTPAISPATLARLEEMTREGLITLIQKVYQAGWGYGGSLSGKELIEAALKSDDDLYDAILLRGKALCLTATDRREYTTLATFITERMRGKPTQAINTTVTIGLPEIMEEIARRRKQVLLDVTPQQS